MGILNLESMVVTTNRVTHTGSGYGTNNSQCTVSQYVAASAEQSEQSAPIPAALFKHLKSRPFFRGSTDMENSGQGPSAWTSTASASYGNPDTKREPTSPDATVVYEVGSTRETSRFRRGPTAASVLVKERPNSARMRAADPILREDSGRVKSTGLTWC